MNRIIKLTKFLNECRDAYYNQHQSLVSDKKYDDLFDELSELENNNNFKLSNSPTVSVGYEVKSELNKVEHNHKMLSLDKTKDINDLVSFVANHDSLIMAKMDGLTVSLRYSNGKLVGAETRGDGYVGEDILHNARVFMNIPLRIPILGEYVIDGEAIISDAVFCRINDELSANGKQKYKNARNLASGSVRQLDSNIAASRDIKFIAWKVVSGDDDNSFSQRLCNAEKIGFEIVPYFSLIKGTKEPFISKYVTDLRQYCESCGYGIDGMVVSYDDVGYGESLGETSHHVRSQLAYKFYDEKQCTILRDIEWSTSRTGQINPVAIFDPIEIDGTTVERASLSNVSIIEELELGIGDRVRVIKANQIIPQIAENITKGNTYEIPKVCPSCGKPVSIKNDSGRKTLYCDNQECSARIHDKMVNFCGKRGMDIRGLSEERLNVLMKSGLVTDFASIYNLKYHRREMIQLDGLGESSVSNVLAAIDTSRKCKLENVIVAIGIPNVGKSMAKQIAKYVIDRFVDDKNENPLAAFLYRGLACTDWSVLQDFGSSTSQNINSYIRENWCELKELIPILDVSNETTFAGGEKLTGIVFCITGSLDIFGDRNTLVSVIEKNGGKVSTNVTKKTNYLISNDLNSESAKCKRARELGTKIITEAEFNELLK